VLDTKRDNINRVRQTRQGSRLETQVASLLFLYLFQMKFEEVLLHALPIQVNCEVIKEKKLGEITCQVTVCCS